MTLGMLIAERTKMEIEMPADTLDSVPTHARRGILWLVVVHVAVSFLTALLVKSDDNDYGLAWDVSYGVFLSQTSLLGVWCALGTSRHGKRLMGGIIGVGLLYLYSVIISGDWDMEQLVFPGVFTAFVATPCLVARGFRVVIQVDSSPTTLASRLRFSIRDLLVLTFAVACLVALGRAVLPFIQDWMSASGLVIVATLLILFSVIPVWLLLATKRPLSYGIGLVAMSACSGYCLAQSTINWSASEFTAFTTTSMSVVVVSLLVVRRCGYRLVRLPKSTHRRSGLDEFTLPHINDEDSQPSPLSQ